jgi:hypothetical protein
MPDYYLLSDPSNQVSGRLPEPDIKKTELFGRISNVLQVEIGLSISI